MCGIIGILGQDGSAAERAMEALKRLEYRGYDSAGIATLDGGKLDRRRAAGKLSNLQALLLEQPITGRTGIGHTRWATHGAATTSNAHPHFAGPVALVHNGIIENFRRLREDLEAKGHVFETETDTETVAHLISAKLSDGLAPVDAVKAALAELEGAFALSILIEGHDDLLIGARKGSPLVIGVGDGEMFLGSDALAVAPFTNRVVYLEEGDCCVLSRTSYVIYEEGGAEVSRPQSVVQAAGAAVEKGNYRHFMQKEIFEQPTVVAQTLGSYLRQSDNSVALPQFDFDLSQIKRVTIVACGTSFYAGMVAKYWFEQFARVPVDIDVASEFRYREPVLEEGGLALFISQSGETADTLAALRHCKANGQTIAVVV
ncbi:MAG: glutamine--fructose-6-phosphate transaminase (isomerizing), partial [Pseudomonadota bacterium]|nr:glutamine--fructose-6-phosphate transaminase (isomerizing) [Pseudomonadota bacterium]